jgi:hypothetical protein
MRPFVCALTLGLPLVALLTPCVRRCCLAKAPFFGACKPNTRLLTFGDTSHSSAISYHQIFLKSIIDFHQLGRKAVAEKTVAAHAPCATFKEPLSVCGQVQHSVVNVANGGDGDPGQHAAAAEAADRVICSDAHARPLSAASSNASNALTLSAENLSRVIGQQVAEVRLRAAAEWVDARADSPWNDDFSIAASAEAGRRDSFADDDMPLVQPPPHLLQARLPPAIDSRPTTAHLRPLPAHINSMDRRRWDPDTRRFVDAPSIGSKRPASALGSSASNAIVIDDD